MLGSNKQLWPTTEPFPGMAELFANAEARIAGRDVIADRYGLIEIRAPICRYRSDTPDVFHIGGWERAVDRLRALDASEALRVETEYAEMRCRWAVANRGEDLWFRFPMLASPEVSDG